MPRRRSVAAAVISSGLDASLLTALLWQSAYIAAAALMAAVATFAPAGPGCRCRSPTRPTREWLRGRDLL